MPDVTFIIPHFNRAALLHETLKSLQNQEVDTWEAIVVDDSSTEDEWTLAKSFQDARVSYLRRVDGLKGPSRCRNLGLLAASSLNIVFVDSDDVVAPWAIKQRLDSINRWDKVDFIVFPVALFVNQPGDENRLWNRMDGAEDIARFLAADPVWHTSSPIWRRDSLLKLGGFNEEVMYGDDSELHIRAILRGLRYVKNESAMPDVFVRRGTQARITNTLSPSHLESRRNRLIEGSKVLAEYGTEQTRKAWEGQYFIEAEFLLFNCEGSRREQQKVVSEWKFAHRPPFFRFCIVIAYLAIANATREHAYILLRLARRFAKLLLPGCFFPNGSCHEKATSPNETFEQIRLQLYGNNRS